MKLSGDRCKCVSCGLYFNSTAAFDKHRSGAYATDRRCLTVTEMADKGFRTNKRGFFVFGKNPGLWTRRESEGERLSRESMERAHRI
jgi:hypothetical protein